MLCIEPKIETIYMITIIAWCGALEPILRDWLSNVGNIVIREFLVFPVDFVVSFSEVLC